MKTKKECLVCQRDQNEMPVTKFYYKESEFFICAEHMPVLIHNPEKLVGLLPGAANMTGG